MKTPSPRTGRPGALLFVALASLAAAASLAAVTGCKKQPAAADTEKTVAAVQAVHPEQGAITEDITADATLAPIAQAAIQPKISAPIKRFLVQRGSHVGAGQLVAVLENSDLQAAALDNQGALKAAQGAYTAATQQTVPQEQTQARLDLTQAEATLKLNQQILKAREQLLAQGAIPGRDVDTARATALQSQAAYDIAKQKYESLQRVGEKASIETAQGNLTSAKGKALGAEAQLSYTNIRTPIRGVVTERPLFAGETATAGSALLTIMDTSTLIAKLHIAQEQAQELALGAPAKLDVPGSEDPVDAKVSLISPAVDPGSTTVEVWLNVPNAQGKLRAGTSVHATIKGHTVPHALLIPSEAVQRSSEGAGRIVMIVTPDGTAQKRTITTGIETKETTQVLSGLNPGDTVITSGGYGLDDGTKVKIEAPGKADAPAGGKE